MTLPSYWAKAKKQSAVVYRLKVLFPIPTINKQDVIFLKDLVYRGSYRPLIDRSYTLEQIVEAYRYVETGQKIGNVVIIVTDKIT